MQITTPAKEFRRKRNFLYTHATGRHKEIEIATACPDHHIDVGPWLDFNELVHNFVDVAMLRARTTMRHCHEAAKGALATVKH